MEGASEDKGEIARLVSFFCKANQYGGTLVRVQEAPFW
jgi:hypothetical protein